MSILDLKRPPRTLYIIAPKLIGCHRAAIEWGLDPLTMVNIRNVTTVCSLRGTTAGTPFITHGREFWADTAEGFDLDRAVATLQRTGRLRIARADDLDACRHFDALPSRPMAAQRVAI